MFSAVQPSRYNQYNQPQGKTPLREGTYAREANAQSFGHYNATAELGDVVLGEHERVVSTERLSAQVVEQPILVPDFRIVERGVERVKPVVRVTTHEQPVVQNIPVPVQIVKEVPVERIVEKPYTRKVIVERIIEQVVEVVKEVPVERIVEQVIEVVKEVPVEKVVERVQIKEIPVVETEERVVEVVREIPVEIVKEVPVYIKVDPTEWDSRHNLRSSTNSIAYPTGNFTQQQGMMVQQQLPAPPLPAVQQQIVAVGGVGMRLARYGDSGNKTFVCEVVPNSPAEESRQINLDDVVTHVDGQDVTVMSLDQVNMCIRGPVGTIVNIQTSSEYGSKTVTLERRAYGN